MKINIILLKSLLILILTIAIIPFKNILKFKTKISFNELSNFTKNNFHYDTNKIIAGQLIIENNHSNISKDEVSNKINIISYDNDSDITQVITNNTEIKSKIKRVGIVSVKNDLNPGNNLVKFSIATKLKEYGFEPIIIALGYKNIDFI